MKCSYSECDVQFNKEQNMGYAMHIFDHINETVVWGAYCSADCVLLDMGPFFLARAEAESQTPEPDFILGEGADDSGLKSELMASQLLFVSLLSEELLEKIASGKPDWITEVNVETLKFGEYNTKRVEATIFVNAEKTLGCTLVHDHNTIVFTYKGIKADSVAVPANMLNSTKIAEVTGQVRLELATAELFDVPAQAVQAVQYEGAEDITNPFSDLI